LCHPGNLVLAAGVVAVILNLVLPSDESTDNDKEGVVERELSLRDVENEVAAYAEK
jgi:hypothetical protein